MPTYEIQNEKTGEVKEVFCSYNDKEKELKKHGKDWVYLIGAPGISHDTINTIKRAGSGWNDHLSRIAEANPASKLGENMNRRTAKQIKVEKVRNDHRKRKK
tara:strand:- start:6952 stop:7257 length:306 start_codon:yes stop_codon:yes gene_type:complete